MVLLVFCIYMSIYFLLVIYYIVLCIICYFLRRKYTYKTINKIFLTLFFTVCSIIMGLRDISVGVDTGNYQRMFYEFSFLSYSDIFSSYYHSGIEVGFVLLNKLFSVLVNDYYFFQFIFSSIFCFLMAVFIYKSSSNVFLSSIVFVGSGLYLSSFNIFRQMLAVSVVVNSLPYLQRNELRKVLLLLIIGILIHTSSMIFIFPIILFVWMNNRMIKLIPGFFIFISFYWQYAILLVRYIGPDNYLGYAENTREIMEAGMVRILWLIVAVFSLIVVYNKSFSTLQKKIAILCIVYVSCFWIGLNFNYFERLGLYFQPFIIPLFVFIGEKIPTSFMRCLYCIVVSICFIIFFMLASESKQYVYNSFLM